MSIFTIEFATHQVRDYQVKEVTEYAIQEIQNHGGYTDVVSNKILKRMEKHGLIAAGYSIEAPNNKIEFEEEFNVKLKGEFTYRALNILGSDVGNLTVPLSATGVGIGQVYFR